MNEFSLDDMLRLGAENSRLKAKVARLETFIQGHRCEGVFCPSCGAVVPKSGPQERHDGRCELFTQEGQPK